MESPASSDENSSSIRNGSRRSPRTGPLLRHSLNPAPSEVGIETISLASGLAASWLGSFIGALGLRVAAAESERP